MREERQESNAQVEGMEVRLARLEAAMQGTKDRHDEETKNKRDEENSHFQQSQFDSEMDRI